jgi:hypothetical protein
MTNRRCVLVSDCFLFTAAKEGEHQGEDAMNQSIDRNGWKRQLIQTMITHDS